MSHTNSSSESDNDSSSQTDTLGKPNTLTFV